MLSLDDLQSDEESDGGSGEQGDGPDEDLRKKEEAVSSNERTKQRQSGEAELR